MSNRQLIIQAARRRIRHVWDTTPVREQDKEEFDLIRQRRLREFRTNRSALDRLFLGTSPIGGCND